MTFVMDDDVILATADLVRRTGARQFEAGYLHDDVPIEEAGWYAAAILKGTKIIEENHRGPVEACEALARRILTGATCRCGKLVALSDKGAVVYPGAQMMDGTTMTKERARRIGQCRWQRLGPRWVKGCEGRRNA